MVKLNGKDFDESALSQSTKVGKALTPEQIKGMRIGQGKGENSFTSFYGYMLLPGVKPVANTIPGATNKEYYVFECILLDLETHKPVKRGVISVNAITRPNVTYSDMETLKVTNAPKQFPDFPDYQESRESRVEYIDKYFVGKIIVPAGEIEIIRPRFDESGIICYTQPDGTPLPIRKIPTMVQTEWV